MQCRTSPKKQGRASVLPNHMVARLCLGQKIWRQRSCSLSSDNPLQVIPCDHIPKYQMTFLRNPYKQSLPRKAKCSPSRTDRPASAEIMLCNKPSAQRIRHPCVQDSPDCPNKGLHMQALYERLDTPQNTAMVALKHSKECLIN